MGLITKLYLHLLKTLSLTPLDIALSVFLTSMAEQVTIYAVPAA